MQAQTHVTCTNIHERTHGQKRTEYTKKACPSTRSYKRSYTHIHTHTIAYAETATTTGCIG